MPDQLVGCGQRPIGAVCLLVDMGVLPGGDPFGEQICLARQQPGTHILVGVLRCHTLHEPGGALMQGPLGLVVPVPLDAPVRGIGCRRVDPGQRQGERVGPCAMPVGVVDEDRAVGNDGVESLLGRAPTWKPGLMPATAEDPFRLRVIVPHTGRHTRWRPRHWHTPRTSTGGGRDHCSRDGSERPEIQG